MSAQFHTEACPLPTKQPSDTRKQLRRYVNYVRGSRAANLPEEVSADIRMVRLYRNTSRILNYAKARQNPVG